MKITRSNATYSQQEKAKNISRIKTIRTNETYAQRESERNVKRMHKIRSSNMYTDEERHRNREHMRSVRTMRISNQNERVLNHQRMQQLRTNKHYVLKESMSRSTKTASRHTTSFQILQQQFWQSISVGPEYVCFSCEQLWYRESVVAAQSLKEKVRIGRTYKQYVNYDKVPPLSRTNNTSMPGLNKLHNRIFLINGIYILRTPFMQIRELPRGRQLSITGNVVNVPADVSNTIKILPRRIDESDTIPVKFKRKLTYKHTVWSQCVRPKKVLEAANWLVTNSDLYKDLAGLGRKNLISFRVTQ
ncbi:hypothetical protein HOLleu_00213 [Holothuria leucospilota]|uniref:DUF6570 domain-containing protein n=1 Tax=Holothuria leucospilota TaxID=206669 RepID=A0A9Q1CMP8_HOLLE|nr:hypothetical protein HOLleu_00213 [Holothuria leucospilota]